MRLYKPRGESIWHVEVKTAGGALKSLPTGCEDKDDALVVAKAAHVAELEKAGKRLSEEVVNTIVNDGPVVVQAAFESWVDWTKMAIRSERTRINNIQTVEQWISQMNIGQVNVGTVNSNHIHDWVNDPNKADKLGTRAFKLSCVKNFMGYCHVKRYIMRDPSPLVTIDYRAISHEQRETKHKVVFSDGEISFLLSNCAGEEPPSISQGFFKASIILGRDLALRLGDICSLEWACFDFKTGLVTVWTDKANTRVQIPMTDRVAKLVQGMEHTHGKHLFPLEREIAIDPKRRAMLSVIFGRFLKGLGFEEHSFHSLRATFATAMAAKGATVDEIAKALGHSSSGPTKSYIRKEGAANVASKK